MFGDILTLPLNYFTCRYDYKADPKNKSRCVFNYHNGRKVCYRFGLGDDALSLLYDIFPSCKIILWGTKLRNVILWTGERFLIRIPAFK